MRTTPARLKAELLMALRTVRRSKSYSVLAVIAIAIGVSAVILLVSFAQLARTTVHNEFTSMGTTLFRLAPGRSETRGVGGVPQAGSHPITLSDVRFLQRRLAAFAPVSALTIGAGTIRFGDRSRALMIGGADEAFPAMYGLSVALGRYFSAEDSANDRRVCVLGERAQRELFADQNPVGQFVEIYSARFLVVGTFAPRGNSFGVDLDDLVIIPTASALDIFHLQSVQRVLINAPSRDAMYGLIQTVTDVLAARHRGVDFTVLNPDDLLATVDQVMRALTALVVVIATLSLFVGGVGIANVMLLSVDARTQEIGVRRALGATRADIMRQFLSEAATLAFVGGTLGVVVAGLVVIATRLSSSVSVSVQPLWAVLAVVLAMVIGVGAGAAPARRAGTVSPMEAMRAE